jgi:hypothetical protein
MRSASTKTTYTAIATATPTPIQPHLVTTATYGVAGSSERNVG